MIIDMLTLFLFKCNYNQWANKRNYIIKLFINIIFTIFFSNICNNISCFQPNTLMICRLFFFFSRGHACNPFSRWAHAKHANKPTASRQITLTRHRGTCWGIYFGLSSLNSYSSSYSYCLFSPESQDSSEEQLWETFFPFWFLATASQPSFSLSFLSVGFETYLRLLILNNHKHGGSETHYLSFGPGAIFFLMSCCHMDGLHWTNDWSGWNECESPKPCTRHSCIHKAELLSCTDPMCNDCWGD